MEPYSQYSLSVMPDPMNMGVAVGISLLSCIRADIYVIPIISGEWPPYLISNMPGQGTVYSSYVLPDPRNMGVAVGISLLSCVSAEICATEFSKPPYWISDFRLSTRSLLLLL